MLYEFSYLGGMHIAIVLVADYFMYTRTFRKNLWACTRSAIYTHAASRYHQVYVRKYDVWAYDRTITL